MYVYRGSLNVKIDGYTADNEEITVVVFGGLNYGTPVAVSWQWTQVSDPSGTKVPIRQTGFIDSLAPGYPSGSLRFAFCYNTAFPFEATATGADSFTITMIQGVSPSSTVLTRVYAAADNYRSAGTDGCLFSGIINATSPADNVATAESFDLVLPPQFVTGGKALACWQWTTTADDTPKAKVEVTATLTVPPPTDNGTQTFSASGQLDERTCTLDGTFDTDGASVTLTVTIGDNTSDPLQLALVREKLTPAAVSRHKRSAYNPIETTTTVFNDSEKMVLVTIKDADKSAYSKGVMSASMGLFLTVAGLFMPDAVEGPILVSLATAINFASFNFGLYGVADALIPGFDPVVDYHLFPGQTLYRTRRGLPTVNDNDFVITVMDTTPPSGNPPAVALKVDSATKSSAGEETYRVKDLLPEGGSPLDFQPTFSLGLRTVESIEYVAVVRLRGFAPTDSGAPPTVDYTHLERAPTKTLLSYNSTKNQFWQHNAWDPASTTLQWASDVQTFYLQPAIASGIALRTLPWCRANVLRLPHYIIDANASQLRTLDTETYTDEEKDVLPRLGEVIRTNSWYLLRACAWNTETQIIDTYFTDNSVKIRPKTSDDPEMIVYLLVEEMKPLSRMVDPPSS